MFADWTRLGAREQMWYTNVAEKLQEEGTARCRAAMELYACLSWRWSAMLCDVWLSWVGQGCCVMPGWVALHRDAFVQRRWYWELAHTGPGELYLSLCSTGSICGRLRAEVVGYLLLSGCSAAGGPKGQEQRQVDMMSADQMVVSGQILEVLVKDALW